MVSDRIKNLRISKGLTQEQLGEILGVGKATVQKYESGQIQNLKTAHIKKLCELFHKKPHYFIFDDLENYEKADEKMIHDIEITYGDTVSKIVVKSLSLNEKGHERLLQLADDLSFLEKYTKTSNRT